MLRYHGENLELIQRGAEADIMKGKWCGIDAIFKVRKAIEYRNGELDRLIRIGRTVREAEIINRAKKSGVRTPYIYFLDIPNTTIVMEEIKGLRLKELLNQDERKSAYYSYLLGKKIALLHKSNIIHGDITTSNVIVREGDLCFIDFGLSFVSTRVEDRAIDLRLIKEILSSVHTSSYRECYEGLVKGYVDAYGKMKAAEVLRQLSSIEKRGRYTKLE